MSEKWVSHFWLTDTLIHWQKHTNKNHMWRVWQQANSPPSCLVTMTRFYFYLSFCSVDELCTARIWLARWLTGKFPHWKVLSHSEPSHWSAGRRLTERTNCRPRFCLLPTVTLVAEVNIKWAEAFNAASQSFTGVKKSPELAACRWRWRPTCWARTRRWRRSAGSPWIRTCPAASSTWARKQRECSATWGAAASTCTTEVRPWRRITSRLTD